MVNELAEEWCRLSDEAKAIIRKGSGAESPRFRLFVWPAFWNRLGWEVWRNNRDGPTGTAVLTTWRVDIDGPKFRSPVERLRYPRPMRPTIEVTRITIDGDWLQSRIETLRALSIAAMPLHDTIGLDGVTYELHFNAGFFHGRYEWFVHPSGGWEPLGEWMDETLEGLELMTARQRTTQPAGTSRSDDSTM